MHTRKDFRDGFAALSRLPRLFSVLIFLPLFMCPPFDAVGGGQQSEPLGESPDPVWVISRGNDGDRYAAVHVIKTASQLEEAPISEALHRKIESDLHWDTQAAVVFFAGTRTTGGYSLEIGEITRAENSLVIRIREIAPAPDAIVTQALTYPYIAIGVDDPPASIAVEGPSR